MMMSCGGSAEKQTQETKEATKVETIAEGKVVVYYFHSKQRCKTCLAIQDVAAQTIEENFADNTDVKFVELDFTEKNNEAIAEKYEVAGSSLIIASGEENINLTSVAFANALRSPETLNDTIVDEVNKLLNN